MKFLKVLFLLFLFMIVCFSLYHIVSQKIVPSNAYVFSIASLLVFSVCFLLIVLNIKIGGKYVSLERDISDIKQHQEELSLIATAFYNLTMVNLVISRHKIPPKNLIDKHHLLTKELNKYLDLDNIAEFTDGLFDIN